MVYQFFFGGGGGEWTGREIVRGGLVAVGTGGGETVGGGLVRGRGANSHIKVT